MFMYVFLYGLARFASAWPGSARLGLSCVYICTYNILHIYVYICVCKEGEYMYTYMYIYVYIERDRERERKRERERETEREMYACRNSIA